MDPADPCPEVQLLSDPLPRPLQPRNPGRSGADRRRSRSAAREFVDPPAEIQLPVNGAERNPPRPDCPVAGRLARGARQTEPADRSAAGKSLPKGPRGPFEATYPLNRPAGLKVDDRVVYWAERQQSRAQPQRDAAPLDHDRRRGKAAARRAATPSRPTRQTAPQGRTTQATTRSAAAGPRRPRPAGETAGQEATTQRQPAREARRPTAKRPGEPAF